jgi:hypothetical protein
MPGKRSSCYRERFRNTGASLRRTATPEAAADARPADAHQILAPALAFRDELLTAGRPLAWVSMMKRLAEERHGIPLGGVRAPLPDASAGDLLPSLRDLLTQLDLVPDTRQASR